MDYTPRQKDRIMKLSQTDFAEQADTCTIKHGTTAGGGDYTRMTGTFDGAEFTKTWYAN